MIIKIFITFFTLTNFFLLSQESRWDNEQTYTIKIEDKYGKTRIIEKTLKIEKNNHNPSGVRTFYIKDDGWGFSEELNLYSSIPYKDRFGLLFFKDKVLISKKVKKYRIIKME